MRKELEDILSKMNDIKYGFIDSNKNIYPDTLDNWSIDFANKYQLQSPEDLMNSECGVCWDQVELERFYLKEKNIIGKSYFIIANDNDLRPTHTFMVIKDDKYYWLEHSLELHKGVHEYNSLEELISDVKSKFDDSLKKSEDSNYEIALYLYDQPKYHLNCEEFMKYCEQGQKINVKEG